jgi:hypothetical protein
MATFDVFISYSTVDKPIADQTCAALEAAGIQCWIAPRNIPVSKNWGSAIVEGIESSRAMVVVFSAAANDSEQVEREVASAVEKRMPLVLMRIADVQPTKAMAYFLKTVQWLVAFPPPTKAHFPKLVDAVKNILAEIAPPPEKDSGTQGPVTVPRPNALEIIKSTVLGFAAQLAALFRRRSVQWLLLALAVVIAVGAAGAVAVQHEISADWVDLPAGSYFANMNQNMQSVPAFAIPDRSSEKKLDIQPLRRIPVAGSKQLLARKRIWFAGGSLWFENWIRFPLGSGSQEPQAYVPEGDVVMTYPK